MKVTIGKYKKWFGPYQLADKLCFWAKKVPGEDGITDKPEWVYQFGEWLAYGSIEPETQVGEKVSWDRDRHDTVLSKFLTWADSKKKRTVNVQIDSWDTWSMDSTLAYIILPMLKQLKETNHGGPQVDIKDCPDHLKPNKKELANYKKNGEVDDRFFDRWNWVMDEMIFAFDSKVNTDWEDQFETGVSDIQWMKLENGNSEMIHGPNDTKVYDWDGRKVYEERIQNGFRLFGVYYQNLWD